MGKVPNTVSPVLQVDIAQIRIGTDEQFNSAAMHRGLVVCGAGRFGKDRRFGARFENDQNVA